MRKPFEGNFPITQHFGEKITDPKGHTGIDYATYTGTPVLAAMDGTVSRICYLSSGYGTHIILDHEGGLQSIYAHLSAVEISIGSVVLEGQKIGYSGNTGNSTGPHLHFELRREGRPIDPEGLLSLPISGATGSCRVNVPELYVRSGPGTEYAIVGSLHRGDCITGEETADTVWLKIGMNRWVAIRYQGKDFCENIE